MKIEKNKMVFISVVAIVIMFIGAYTALVLTGNEEATDELKHPLVPALKEEKKNYTSKVEALNDLKEVRRNDPPSIYSEKLLDSLGVYDPALEEKEREWVVDSIYNYGNIDYEQAGWRENDYVEEEWGEEQNEEQIPSGENSLSNELTVKSLIDNKDFAITHKDFFRAGPLSRAGIKSNGSSDTLILASVHGSQVVRMNDRLELILSKDAKINDRIYPKNTLLYGFVSLQPNRLHLKITHINNRAVKLKAYDFQDSNEGVYVENRLKAEATREVLDGVIQDINIAGIPQIGGIKNILRRSNRNLKVTVMDQYQLVLKPEL